MNFLRSVFSSKILMILSAISFTDGLLAEVKPEVVSSKDNKPSKDEPKPISLTVPSWLSDGGYILYVDGSEWVFGKDPMVVNPSLDRVAVELYDAQNRLVDFKRNYVDPDLIEELRNRKISGGIDFAYIQASTNKGWRDLFLSGARFSLGLEADWRWGGIHVLNRFRYLVEGQQTGSGVSANYGAAELAFGAGVVLAPFKNKRGYFRKVSFWPAAGFLAARHVVRISDGVVGQSDGDYSLGGWAKFITKFPLANNFSSHLGLEVSRQEIEFEKFGVSINAIDFGILFGGSYAF